MSAIADGTYDVIVVSADEAPDGSIVMEIAFISGANKGSSVTLRSPMPIDRALEVLGLPGTLHVQEGRPRLVFE